VKKPKDITIGNVTVALGETKDINMFIAKLYDFTDIYMPVKVIRGEKEGPRLFVCAAIHGDEVNGVEIVKGLAQSKCLKGLRGTLIAVPMVNVFGFNNLSRYLPDGRDLNRCFPGSKTGSMTSRLAAKFVCEILGNSTHGIDLHTGARHRTNLPQVRACLDDAATNRLAHEFNVPVILDAVLIKGSLRKIAYQKGIPLIVFEGGEPLRFDETAVRCGLDGVLSVMHALDMIDYSPKRDKKIKSFIANETHWVRAAHSGIFVLKRKLGSVIKPGDLLGVISDPLGKKNIEVRAPKRGVIICHTQLPLVNRGDALLHVASFGRTRAVSRSIEQFDDRFDYEER